MDANDFYHKVFKNDPQYFLSLLGKYVVIYTKYNTKINGFIDAIDPVTESIIISFTSSIEKNDQTIVIMGHAVEKIEVDTPKDYITKQIKEELQDSEKMLENLAVKKLRVQKWLSKNLLPVEDNDGVLQVHNAQLCIAPPYRSEDCISNNSIILGRIQHLLQNMPEDNI